MIKKILIIVLVFVLTFGTYFIADAQIISRGDILRSASENLKNARTMTVSGSIDTTFDKSSISNFLLLRMLLPTEFVSGKMQVGFDFEGNIDKTTSTMTTWKVTPDFIRPSTTIGISTNDEILYIESNHLLNSLIENELLNPAITSNWISVDVNNFADKIGLSEWDRFQNVISEKRERIMRIMENPGNYFRVTQLSDINVNGDDNFRFRIDATGAFLDEFYPNTVTVNSRGALVVLPGFTRTGSGELWIEKESLQPTRLIFSTRLLERGVEEDRFNIDLSFDNFNEQVEVEIPSSAVNLDQVLNDVFDNISNFFVPGTLSPTTSPTPTTIPNTPTTTNS